MDNQDYMDKVKEQIKHDKLLHLVKPKNHDKLEILLQRKKRIMQENGFLADFKLRRINKKIQKLVK